MTTNLFQDYNRPPPAYRERVSAGANLLDAKVPDWVEQIDLGTLVLASPCDCILGQVGGTKFASDSHSVGGYSTMLERLELTINDRDDAFDFGFDIAYDEGLDETDDSEFAFHWLQIAWTDLINDRKDR